MNRKRVTENKHEININLYDEIVKEKEGEERKISRSTLATQ